VLLLTKSPSVGTSCLISLITKTAGVKHITKRTKDIIYPYLIKDRNALKPGWLNQKAVRVIVF